MSRKDYQSIAAALCETQPAVVDGDRCNDALRNQWQATVSAIADVFAADNPRFDRVRFLRACNGGEK